MPKFSPKCTILCFFDKLIVSSYVIDFYIFLIIRLQSMIGQNAEWQKSKMAQNGKTDKIAKIK